MHRRHHNPARGFTLMELMISLAIGMLVIGLAVQLFSHALNATFIVSERAQMQQDSRAAEDMIVNDISQAGSGLQPGGIGLATGTGKFPVYGCDQVKCYVGGGGGSPAGIAYPNQYMYWIVPGYQMGPILQVGQPPTDVITVVYADPVFLLNEYTVAFDNPSGTQVTFSPAAAPPPTPPQAVSDPVYGLKAGDLVLFQNSTGGVTAQAIGEVSTTATGAGPNYVVNFSDPDALAMNQTGATGGDLAQITGGLNTTATRIFAITYYVDNTTDPNHYRLMRQVNGQTPAPVTDNISGLQITYDTYDNFGNLQAGVGTLGATSPNMIRKVNLKHLTFRSAMTGVVGFQGLDIQTSVSARNMSFENRYD
ncbi:MAG TPA: prepilin-type N-terminal cleavage/methylation domain-containing protein [Terriglobales bacterium]|nr:prepilin-type N-terminal cleavage/methylation domain-containing protein [Terriglobales bacterium]